MYIYAPTPTHQIIIYTFMYVYTPTNTPKNSYATTRATHLPKFQRHAGEEEEEAAEAEEAEAESSKCAERSPVRVLCHVAPLSVCVCVWWVCHLRPCIARTKAFHIRN